MLARAEPGGPEPGRLEPEGPEPGLVVTALVPGRAGRVIAELALERAEPGQHRQIAALVPGHVEPAPRRQIAELPRTPSDPGNHRKLFGEGAEMTSRKSISTRFTLFFAGGLASLFLMAVTPAQAQSPKQPAISEEARAAIERMGKTLQAQQFSFHSHIYRAYVGPNGELLHIAHSTKTEVRRPDHLRVNIIGDDVNINMYYDGKTLVAFNPEHKIYASIPITGSIDKMLDFAETKLGVDFVLSDFLSDDPAKSVLSGLVFGGQVGTAIIDGVRCRHFFFNQEPDIDAELWLEDNDRSLPRRVIMTYRSLAGRPNFIAELSDWDFSRQFPDSDFVFNPPPGVQQVKMTPKVNTASEPAK